MEGGKEGGRERVWKGGRVNEGGIEEGRKGRTEGRKEGGRERGRKGMEGKGRQDEMKKE